MSELRKPDRTDRDKEEYFRAEFRCPTCGAFLTSYTYGRASTENGLDDFKLIDCRYCGQKIDWSEEPKKRTTLKTSGVVVTGEMPELTKHKTMEEVLYKLSKGVYTVNQAREALGLPPITVGREKEEV